MTKTYKIEFDDKITNAFNFQNFLMEKGSALDEPVNDYDDETDLSSEDENEKGLNESIIFLTERQWIHNLFVNKKTVSSCRINSTFFNLLWLLNV